MGWAKRRIPEFAPLPFENQRLIVEIARTKAVYTYREQLGLIARFLLPVLAGYTLLFFMFHDMRFQTHARNNLLRFEVTAVFGLCGLCSVTLATHFRRTLLLPRIRAEMTDICPGCGYNLRGVSSANCPECGAIITQKSQQSGSALDAAPFSATSGPVTAVESLCRSEDLVPRYALKVLTVPAHPEEQAASFIRNVNEVMLRWVRFRGDACEKLQFAFRHVPPQRQAELVSLALRLLKQNVLESRILQNLSVAVSVEDEDGNELSNLGIAVGQ